MHGHDTRWSFDGLTWRCPGGYVRVALDGSYFWYARGQCGYSRSLLHAMSHVQYAHG